MSADLARPGHWLVKSEPEVFSIDDLQARGREPWDGVRNYQARNYMRDQMRPGDPVLLYHSSCAVPAVVGLASVDSDAEADPTQFDPASEYFDPGSDAAAPRWWLRRFAFVERFARPVTLQDMKQWPDMDDFLLLRRGNRLSVLPVPAAAFECILRAGRER